MCMINYLYSYFQAWMSNYILLFCMRTITYPYSNIGAGLAMLLKLFLSFNIFMLSVSRNIQGFSTRVVIVWQTIVGSIH